MPVKKQVFSPLTLLLAVGMLLLAFWLRIQALDTYPPGLSNDEAVNAIDAFHLSQSGVFPLYEDPNRPEPLTRIIQAGGVILFGPSVWAFRFTAGLIGMLTIAAACWATRECLRDRDAFTQQAAGLAAGASLAVAVGYLTLTRGLYRAVPQPLFMLLFAGLLLRGLRGGKRWQLVASGVSLAAAMYTYTAALVIPATLGAVGLSVLIFQTRRWRDWLPRLVIVGVSFAILVVPIGLLYLDNATAVIGRAGEVSEGGIGRAQLQAFVDEFFVTGDENPQYNVESAPLLPPSFIPLFMVGLLALIVRGRLPSSALIAAFLVLSAVPVIAANEITHGLRIMGEFAAFPFIIGLGTALVVAGLRMISTRAIVNVGIIGLIAAITLTDGFYAKATYNDYWGKDYRWRIHNRDLTHSEWFYRTDRRDLAQWMLAQDMPLLVPVDELSWATVRTWLMPKYPTVTPGNETIAIPENTRLVVPWSLEAGDLMRETRHYALLQDGEIILLPPFSAETQAALLDGIDDAEPITREGIIELVGRVKDVPEDLFFAYEPAYKTALVFGGDEMKLAGWRGPINLHEDDDLTLTYTLEWQGLRQMGHEYSAYLQVQTQDQQRIAGDDVRILRWLYPTTVWTPGETVPDVHRLTLPDDLAPGAYRLVVGVYPFITPERFLDVTMADGTALGDSALIGWLKVPQATMPAPDENARAVDATLGDAIALRAAAISQTPDGQISVRLFWQSLVERPDFDATIFVHVLDDGDTIVAQDDARPWGGQYPTFIWGVAEMVETTHLLDVGDADLDGWRLTVGMYTFPGPERLSVIQNGATVPEGRIVLGNLGVLVK